jgi:FkbM family methyltransferase
MIEKLSTGVWVIENDSHMGKWVKEGGGKFARGGDSGLEAALPHIRPGDTVIDIGCNIGGLSYFFAKAVGPGGRVIGIDANPECVECARQNCQQPWCRFVTTALGLTIGRSFLNILTNVGASHLGDVGHIAVDVTPLDLLVNEHALTRVDFIKIDAEGCEPAILRGGAMTIASFRPKMLIEVNRTALARFGESAEDLLKQIEDLGYSWAVALEGIDPASEQYDVLCLPK